jgi:hypothetical protein
MPVGNAKNVFTIQYMCAFCSDCHVPQFFCHTTTWAHSLLLILI